MNDAAEAIQFALISHTNAGKTTLARTLIGMDVGEVRDAPHVTALSESHVLFSTPSGDTLKLWDTPGFGDSVRLVRRLGMSGNPIGWFLREVIDRFRDRPFWLSQQALRTARDAADVVLYLVNSSENPGDAGYLGAEMKILQWLRKPVVVLLNQMGPPRPFAEEQAEQLRWKEALTAYPTVRKVIALDAFARCWVHERVFYEAVGELVSAPKKPAYARLFKAWEQENEARFHAAMKLTAQQIADAARDSEPVEAADGAGIGTVLDAIGLNRQRDGKRHSKRHDRAMKTLMARLDDGISAATAGLLTLHRLDAGAAARINERVLKGFVIRAPVDTRQAGLLGAIVSGAATGLSADLMAGGLTFGAGALLGGVVGAMTFASAAWAFNAQTDRNQAKVQFSDAFLRTLVVTGLLRYLAVAHFGRGRGNFVEGEAPRFWQEEVESAVARNDDALAAGWRAARSGTGAEADNGLAALEAALTRTATQLLDRLYPRP
jgi:hypothetical protein